MYLAQYKIADSQWLQAAIEFSYPQRYEEEARRQWLVRFRALVHGIGLLPQTSTSLRLHLGKNLRASLIAVAPGDQEAPFRRAVGAFTQLEVLTDAEVRYPQRREDHDTMLAYPRFRCRVSLPRLVYDTAWFAFDFRIRTLLTELMTDAQTLEHQLSYHVNVEPLEIDRELQRKAARNALQVAHIPGIPPLLETVQRRISDKVRVATHLCEEFVGADAPATCEWLAGFVKSRFSDKFGHHLVPDFRFEENAFEESLIVTRHAVFFGPLNIDEICGAAITGEERTEMLSWLAPHELIESNAETAVAQENFAEALASTYEDMPSPYTGRDPFFFISYKREDLRKVALLAAEIGRRGYKMWYDKGIPGGAEWDEIIEERIRNCKHVLLFLTRRTIESKYVRREVKFADTLNKPIVAIRMESSIDLSHGMAMLLNQYQMIDGVASRIGDELLNLVRSEL